MQQMETYFTQSTDVRAIILDLLNEAKVRVVVAMAWFTEPMLFNKLIELANKGVKVEIIVTRHEFNRQSPNDFQLVESYDGFFAEVGTDENLMHMKFCVIDYRAVISGSANWTKKAFNYNSEEVTIVKDNQSRCLKFLEEFDRLKIVAGHIEEQKPLDAARVFSIFKIITALIDIGDYTAILPYVDQLKEFEELKDIVGLLSTGRFEKAIQEMETFQKVNTQVVNTKSYQKTELLIQIELLSIQIEGLDLRKVEIESLVDQFNRRYIIELSPLMTQVLRFKAKIYEKLKKHGFIDETYAEAEKEFEEAKRAYQEEIKKDIPDLKEEDEASLKEMYREAVKWCHSDSPERVLENEEEANKVFSELTTAYKQKDIDRVKNIWESLKNGKSASSINEYDELEVLRAKLTGLRFRYDRICNEINELVMSDDFKTINGIDDWNQYFEAEKMKYTIELESLKARY